jgi:hypothetical protein
MKILFHFTCSFSTLRWTVMLISQTTCTIDTSPFLKSKINRHCRHPGLRGLIVHDGHAGVIWRIRRGRKLPTTSPPTSSSPIPRLRTSTPHPFIRGPIPCAPRCLFSVGGTPGPEGLQQPDALSSRQLEQQRRRSTESVSLRLLLESKARLEIRLS